MKFTLWIKKNYLQCDTMSSNSFLFLFAPRRGSLCIFWQETHIKDWGRDLQRDRKWRREGRSQRRQRVELTKQSRGGWSAWDSSSEEGRSAEAVREDSQRWVSIPSGFVEVSRKIHAYDSLQIHEKLHKIVTQPSLSCAWSWPKSAFVRLFFFHSPSRLCFASIEWYV